MARHWLIYPVLLAILLLGELFTQRAFAAEQKRVMLLHSFGRDTKPWNEYAKTIREELTRQSPWRIDITDQSLVTARSNSSDAEAAFVEYLRALFAEHPLDLVVAIGAPAAAFVQRHREKMFSATPMVLTAVDRRRVQYAHLTSNDTAVAVWINYFAAIENMLQVLPDTKNVMVVVGTSPIEKFWKDAIGKELEPLANRIKISWTDHLSLEQLLGHAAALPPQTAIFWELMIVDASGVVHEGVTPLAKLHAVANAPIFSYDESFFGHIVGGPLLLVSNTSRQTAAVAIRILAGEKAGNIQVPPVPFGRPMFDWRELQRWGISQSVLPAGSQIHFRNPSAWERYRSEILMVGATLLLQGALIFWLVYEHRRRNRAEALARVSMSELTHMNRVATVGELSASIAHEVNQPLTGIVTRAGAARRWLSSEKPEIDKAREALTQIEVASHRASEIVTSVRSMFRRDSPTKSDVDINRLIGEILDLVYADLRKCQINVKMELEDGLPLASANYVQLQQVVLNLVMNAIDAMRSGEPRRLHIRSKLNGHNCVCVAIEDTGIGIEPSNRDRIFKPLFTTKTDGMGMGLSVCRTIIENHGGRIWVSAAEERGSVFQFELPTREASGDSVP